MSKRWMLVAGLTVVAAGAAAPDAMIDFIRDLSSVLFRYGPYAVLAVFVYLFVEAGRNVVEAKPDDKPDARASRNLMGACMIVFAVLVAGVWTYGQFIYSPVTCVQGSVRNLIGQVGSRAGLTSESRVVQRLAPVNPHINFFITEERPNPLDDTKYEYDWILRLDRNIASVLFEFQHQSMIPASPTSYAADPNVSNIGHSRPVVQRRRLELPIEPAFREKPLALSYEEDPDDPHGTIGRFLITWEGNRSYIPWAKVTSGSSLETSQAPPPSKSMFSHPSWLRVKPAFALSLQEAQVQEAQVRCRRGQALRPSSKVSQAGTCERRSGRVPL